MAAPPLPPPPTPPSLLPLTPASYPIPDPHVTSCNPVAASLRSTVSVAAPKGGPCRCVMEPRRPGLCSVCAVRAYICRHVGAQALTRYST